MHRSVLLDRLDVSRSVPVVAVVAPPGYGKTTLLVQWAAWDARPFGWLSIDGQDNDPRVLMTCIAVALDRLEPVGRSVFDALAAADASTVGTVLPRLAAGVAARTIPFVLVLDDVHLLSDRECLDTLDMLVEHLPKGSQLALLGRSEPPLPLARLRAEGRVVDVGHGDLAMDPQEADSLLRTAGVELGDDALAELHRRTEGWPAGLQLAAVSMARPHANHGARIARLGTDRFLVDYLHSVLLSHLSDREVRFLVRTAVLDRLCGPLCDAVLGSSGSATLLESLERSSLLVPLDRNRQWYRCNRLFRELLRVELGRREPELVGELVLRAAAWCQDNGLPEAAIEYAMRAGDADRAAGLVQQLAAPVRHADQVTITGLQRWFDWFEENQLVHRYPAVAVLGTLFQALTGRTTAAERWARAAEHALGEGTPSDGSDPIDGWLTLLRALLCRAGVEQMRADAEVALVRVSVDSPWRATALLLLGISHLLAGDPDIADLVLTRAAEAADDAGSTLAASLALAERCILAMERREWREARTLAEQAWSIVRDAGLHDYVTSALLHAAAARLAVHWGDVPGARHALAEARRLQPRLTHVLSFLAVQTRLELARAYLALTDAAGAGSALREAEDLLRRQPNLGVLPRQADQLRSQLDSLRANILGASSLTAAELRLLPLLATHQSFREIGVRLRLSPHTVKSQAMSIYRKLGASSRSQAVQLADSLGLLAA